MNRIYRIETKTVLFLILNILLILSEKLGKSKTERQKMNRHDKQDLQDKNQNGSVSHPAHPVNPVREIHWI